MLKIVSKISAVFILSIAIFFTWNAGRAFAGGGGATGGALEITQIANKVQLVKQVAEAVTQTATQLKQYQNMLLNTLKLDKSTWLDVTKDLQKLRNLYQSAESLTFALSFDSEKFNTRYPGYRSFENINYPTLYKDRVSEWQKYYRAAMEANQMEAKRLLDEQEFLQELHEAANSAEGQVQMVQAGNQIAMYMAQQMTQLRLDMQRQNESQMTYMGNQKQDSIDEQAAWEKSIGKRKSTTPGESF